MHTRDYAFDWIVWVLFLALPLVILWQSATSLDEQGVASGGPMVNAALFPRMIAWLLLGLAVINGARIAFGMIRKPSPLKATPTTRLALIATAIFIVYLIALPIAGYHLATPVLIAVLLKTLGLPFMASLAGGVGMSLLVAAVFEGALNVVLPVGIFQIAVFG